MNRITICIVGLILLLFSACDVLESVNTSDAFLELYGEDNPWDVYDGTANGCDGNDDGDLSQGELMRIQLRVTNTGSEKAESVKLNVSTDDEYLSVVSGGQQTVGDVEVNRVYLTSEAKTSGSILIQAAQGTPDGHIAEFKVEFEDNDGNDWTDRFSLVVESISASILLYGENPYDIYDGTANGCNGNDNGNVEAGEIARLCLRVTNEGSSDAVMVSMVAKTTDQYVSIVDDSTYTFGDMASYRALLTSEANSNSALMISADSNTPSGHSATISLIFTDKYENQWTDNFSLIIQ